MSKGGGSTTTTQSIDPDVKAAYLGNLGYAQQVANQLGPQQFAGFNPQYTAGESQIEQAAQGGVGMQNLDTAADLTRAAAGYSPQNVSAASAGPAAMAMPSGYSATDALAAQANMANIGQYMNPYTGEVINASLRDLETTRQRAAQQIGQQAGAARAFGGSRHGVAEALSNQQFGETAGKTISQLRSQGFDVASNLMQQDLARQQQAALQNAAQRTGASQFGASAQNAAALANQAAYNQMAQYNAANLQQANLANQSAGMQGAQFRLGAASQLGGLGQQQTAGQYAAGQALMGLGTARQQAAQQQLDAQRNLNLQRLSLMQGAIGLNPANLGGTSQTPTYSNPAASALGGAMAGGSMFGPIGAIGGGLLGLFS